MKSIFSRALTLVLCTASPALAETWDCLFKSLSGEEQGISGRSKIEVSGSTLNWLLPPPPGGKDWSKFIYTVVENNEAGIVAILSSSEVRPRVGSVIGVSAVLLNKASGDLRTGSITIGGAREKLGGRCQKNRTTPG